ncbi:MAG: family 20 glycosylhydrolase, partial [Bacteroidales bacterium]|nr:family 20 glycosylhydrolase [Bacteroidales bacterium]
AQKAEDFKFDGIRHGGFYTQEEMRDIVDYAWKLGITVVPEVDLPGHMLSALAAYPELGCTGGPYEVWPIWGVSKQVLCPGKEEAMKFLETVLGELADIFPGEYFHIGGDECPKDEWKASPECQALIQQLGLKTDAHATAEQRLQNYVTSRMQAFLATKGKKIIGWDEILEGDLAEGATVMSWRGIKGGVEASNRGFDVIMTPTDYCYFDYCQAKGGWMNSGEPTCAYWGVLTLEDVYGFDPTAGLNENAAKHILGAQANVWTEYIPSNEQLEYMIMPRLFAMSAVQWCSLESKPDYGTFFQTVQTKGYPMLEQKGFNFRKY